jgi:hypothetical protein
MWSRSLMRLTPKNWKSFQHYKDRSPMWIKLHRGLLDNPDYFRLSPDAGKALPLLWLLASEKDGILPEAPDVAFRLRISEELAGTILAEMVKRSFFIDATHAEQSVPDATPAQRVAKSNGFSSRHIPDEVKRLVWERDGGACCACGAVEKIEYDHIIPVSRQGPSTFENVQLLCRPCNRRKRAQLLQVATQESGSRSLEKNREEKKGEVESRAVAAAPARVPDRFDEFWRAYPRRDGANPRAPAEKKFKALVKGGIDPQVMIAGAAALALAESSKGNVGTPFIPQAMTWLNQQRWSDHAEVAGLLNPTTPEMQIEAAVAMYAKLGRWSRFAGPAPGDTGCRASPELLAKHGLMIDGRKIEVVPEDVLIGG